LTENKGSQRKSDFSVNFCAAKDRISGCLVKVDRRQVGVGILVQVLGLELVELLPVLGDPG
jgi:hypothetical protein